jgi:hypothetical protein
LAGLVPETPDKARAEIDAMGSNWNLVTALLGGTEAMRQAAKKYLPQFPAEKDVFYLDRLSRSTLFNGFRRTVDTMAGKPFSEPMKFGDDVPIDIRGYADNIDLEGRNLQAFAHEVFWTSLAFGLSHILVDHPETPAGLTLAEQKSGGARPYFVHIRPTQIKGWRSERIAGAETLTQLRIMESATESDGQWSVKSITQIRVLEPNRFQIYRQNDKNEWFLFDEGPVSLGAIPLATVYTGRTGFMTAVPPLMDLAFLNVEHWQKASDLSNILHVASVPILFGAGFADDQDILVGTQKAVSSEQVDAKLTYVEHQGHAIGAGRSELQDIEDRMRVLGANLLVSNQSGNRTTATEKSIDSAEADSALSLAALNLQDSLSEALQYIAKWQKLESGGSVVIYRDFDDIVNDTAKGDVLMKMKQEGCISAQSVFEIAKTVLGVVPESMTWESEQARITEEGVVAGIVGSFEQPPNGAAPTAAPVAAAPAKPTSIKRQPDGSYLITDANGQRAVRKQADGSYAIEGQSN